MRRSTISLASAIAAVLAVAVAMSLTAILVAMFAVRFLPPDVAGAELSPPPLFDRDASINRAAKGDRLPATPMSAEQREVKAVEVVGVRDAAIIYRDRDGTILYRTDPLANVTVVAKNVALPEVTIRESAAVDVERVPLDSVRAPTVEPMLGGCESAFGLAPLAGPSRMPSRCVTDLGMNAEQVAALR